MQKALKKGANKVATAIRQEARRAFNTKRTWAGQQTYKSIKSKNGKIEYFPSAYAQVGGAFNLLEYGHRIKRAGKQIGYSEARPFVKPALEKSVQAVDTAVTNEIKRLQSEVVDEAWKRNRAGREGR